MDSFRPEFQLCPFCKSMGNCSSHGHYDRQLVSFENQQVISRHISILRILCSSCGGTHAILPNCIIPFGSFSLSFILQLMKEAYSHQLTVQQLCIKFDIAVSTFYRIRLAFVSHRLLWLGILAAREHKNLDFLEFLTSHLHLADFLADFYSRFSFSFLQQRFITPRCRLPDN